MLLIFVFALLASFSPSSSKPQDLLNLYGMDDASSVLQAAFAHAGISLGDGIAFPAPPTRRPGFFSAARLRNLKLPSFGRRKVAAPLPMLVPIMGTLPKPLKLDDQDQLMAQLNANLFNNAQVVTQSTPTTTSDSKKALDSMSNYQIAWVTPSPVPTTTTTQPENKSRLPISLTRPRSVNHNYATSDSWTPTQYAGFRPLSLDAIAAPSSVIPAAIGSNLSEYLRVWTRRPINNSSDSLEDLFKLTPVKTKITDNKISINHASLLEQINRDADRRSVDCKNKDLGWCDYSDNYPT